MLTLCLFRAVPFRRFALAALLPSRQERRASSRTLVPKPRTAAQSVVGCRRRLNAFGTAFAPQRTVACFTPTT